MTVDAILDTSVLVAGLRSNRGASHRLLRLIGAGLFDLHLSVPHMLEYEETLKRMAPQMDLTAGDVDDLVDYICSVGRHHEINFLWRPFLRDADDDMVLEVAVQAGCRNIVTHNLRDFTGVETFGIRAIAPAEFLRIIGELK
jgi:predicted nucleic acid-binding protein